MPKFAANLTMLFNEIEFLNRFEAAATAGFQAVEYLFPYAYPKDEIAQRLRRHELKQVLFNLPAGDWTKGERGIACLPDRVQEFRDGVALAVEYAATLECSRLNCLAGIAPRDVAPDRLRMTLIDNVRYAAEKLQRADIQLLVEPINTFDIPGFFLHGTKQVLELFASVESGNVYLQYDIYHMQRMEGELAATLKTNISKIAHIQIADNPGRNEPGTGEINFPFLFDWIDSLGYEGWIGCEYKPKETTMSGLGWMRAGN
jgi:hydroxypyruvate isomerase